jgi:hypothetical protein
MPALIPACPLPPKSMPTPCLPHATPHPAQVDNALRALATLVSSPPSKANLDAAERAARDAADAARSAPVRVCTCMHI